MSRRNTCTVRRGGTVSHFATPEDAAAFVLAVERALATASPSPPSSTSPCDESSPRCAAEDLMCTIKNGAIDTLDTIVASFPGLHGRARKSLPSALRVAGVRSLFAKSTQALETLEYMADADSAFRHLTCADISSSIRDLRSLSTALQAATGAKDACSVQEKTSITVAERVAAIEATKSGPAEPTPEPTPEDTEATCDVGVQCSTSTPVLNFSAQTDAAVVVASRHVHAQQQTDTQLQAKQTREPAEEPATVEHTTRAAVVGTEWLRQTCFSAEACQPIPRVFPDTPIPSNHFKKKPRRRRHRPMSKTDADVSQDLLSQQERTQHTHAGQVIHPTSWELECAAAQAEWAQIQDEWALQDLDLSC